MQDQETLLRRFGLSTAGNYKRRLHLKSRELTSLYASIAPAICCSSIAENLPFLYTNPVTNGRYLESRHSWGGGDLKLTLSLG